jgi:dihydrofolate reductase
MGRKTWDSFPRKPLPGRTNIVITRDPNWRAEGAVAVHSLDEALKRAESEKPDEIAVIGGAEIWKLALPRADRIHLTEVHFDAKGDVSVPAFEPARWRETTREDHATADGLRYSYVTLERR